MKFMFLFLFIVVSMQNYASARTSFVKRCIESQKEKNELRKQIEWLSIIFETDDCNQIELQLKELKSFNSIIPQEPSKTTKKYQSFDLKPIELDTTPSFLIKHQNAWSKYKTSFRNLKLFKEFGNFIHLKINDKEEFCTHIQDITSIRVITISAIKFSKIKTDCLNKNSIKVFISGDFNGDEVNSSLNNLIIGIENYSGELKTLQKYKSLFYLGIENFELYANLRDLAVIRKLTNLYLNLKNVATIEEIGRLKSLKFLTLNCIDNEPGTFIPNQDIDKCNGHKLHHIDFISNLLFLKGLDLSWNAIEDMGQFENFKSLEYLNLGMNNISKISNLEKFKSLKKLILRKNKINTLESIKDSAIEFELEGNPIEKESCPERIQNPSIRKICE